jgi:hypothetical protein
MAAPSNILIAQVAPNGEGATHEYVSIYNNSDADIDLTGWCLTYNGSMSKPGCIVAPDESTRMMLAARTHTTFASTAFVAAHEGFEPQARPPFTPGLADSGGTISLINSTGITADSFTWSTKLTSGAIYQRVINSQGAMADTDIDTVDFSAVPFSLPETTGLYEFTAPVDLCSNISGIQATIPDSYFISETGICEPAPIEPEDAIINITELLPNPSSYDTGQEFVELHNSNDRPVNLSGYRLELGPTYSKYHVFENLMLHARGYATLSDTELGFSLPNAAGSLRLLNPQGDVVGETDSYEGRTGSRVMGKREWHLAIHRTL